MSDVSPGRASRDASRQRDTRLGWGLFWLCLLVVLAAAGIWLILRLQHIHTAYPGPSPTVPLAADKSYGVSADLTHYPPEALDNTLAQMKDLGLRWIRQPFPWAEIEPTPGQYNWAPWDSVVEATSARGLQLIAVLDTTPVWARPPDTSPFTPPTEYADYGNFTRALAERYGHQLDYYQIWDEPNLSAHWGDQFIDPVAYTRLLREGAINVRAADSDAVMLTAALAPTIESGPLNLNEPAFLAGLYAANAAPWFDVVAAQPYGFEQNPTAPPDEKSLNFARPEFLRQTMVDHGDGDKPVWATGFGWNTLPQSWEGEVSPWPSLPPDRQAAYTTQAIRQARANWPWLGPMFFGAWDADALPADDPQRGLALVAGQSPLPQAWALGAGQIDGAAPSTTREERATVGTYTADHPSGYYTGDWRFAPAGADVPRLPPAKLNIPFDGTRLDLVVRRGAFRGTLYVSIDGQPANSLPQQAGRAYLVLYDPLEQEAVVTLARHLSDGAHAAIIEAEGGWYQWPIIGWRVSREADTRTIWLGLVLIGGLGMVAAVGLARSARRLSRHDLHTALHWGEALNNRYLALGTPAHLAILAGVALAFYLAPGTPVSLALLGLLLLGILPRPDLGLALVAFSLPFFLLPKPLVGRTISMTEASLVLVALAWVLRRTLILLDETQYRASRGVRWLDWVSWVLAGVAALAAVLTLIPAANTGPLATADWPVLTLMLLPLAGVLTAAAQAGETVSKPATQGVRGLDLAVAVLVGLALAATLAAENFGVSLQEFHVVVWDGAAFYAFIRLTRSLDPQAQTPRTNAESLAWYVVDAFMLGTTLMALYATYQFFFTDQAITAEGVHRTIGVYGSPNNLALLLDRAVPILIAVVAFSSVISSPQSGNMTTRPRRILYALALIPTLTALVLTFSRGALLLGLPAAVLFIGVVRGGWTLWIAGGILITAGIALLPLFGTDRFRSILDINAGTGFFRLRLWQSAWAMLRDFPWLGVGLDNFLYQYRTRYILPDAWQEPNLSHPHNILLDFGTRLGIGGIAVLLWSQIAYWRVAWRLYHRLPKGAIRALILGLMASMIATLAHGLVDNSFFLVDLGFIYMLTLGVVARLAVVSERDC